MRRFRFVFIGLFLVLTCCRASETRQQSSGKTADKGPSRPSGASNEPGLSVVSAERFERYHHGIPDFTGSSEDQSVILVLKIRGLTPEDRRAGVEKIWVKAKAGTEPSANPTARYTVMSRTTTPDFRHMCLSLELSDNSDGSWKQDRELVFAVPLTVGSFELYANKWPMLRFSVIGPVKAELHH